MFSFTPLRIVGDVMLVSLSVVLYIFNFGYGAYIGSTQSWNPSKWATNIMSIGWCVTLVFFFGRDLVQCIRRRGTTSESDCQP
jgi:hypothetical protein